MDRSDVIRPRFRSIPWLTSCATLAALVLVSTAAFAKDDSKSSSEKSSPPPKQRVETRNAQPRYRAPSHGPSRDAGRAAIAPQPRTPDPRQPQIRDGRTMATPPRITDPRLGDSQVYPGSIFGRPMQPDPRDPSRGDGRLGPYQLPQTRAPQSDVRLGVEDRTPNQRAMIWVETPGKDGKPVVGPVNHGRPDPGQPGRGDTRDGGFYMIRGRPAQTADPHVGKPAAPEMVHPQPPRQGMVRDSAVIIKGPIADPVHRDWDHGRPGRFSAPIFTPSCPPTWWPRNYCFYPYHPRVIWFTQLYYWYDPFWSWSSGYCPPSYNAYSSWDYWGRAPYCFTPWGYSYGVAFMFRPLIISLNSVHYGGGGYGSTYANTRPVPYDTVLDDIRTAWLQGDASYLTPHLHPSRGVTLTDADGHEERISAAAFVRITEDGMSWMRTEYFEYVSVRPYLADGTVEADALHVFTDGQGNRQAVRVTYVLGRYNIGGSVRWAIERVVQQPNDGSGSRAGSTGY